MSIAQLIKRPKKVILRAYESAVRQQMYLACCEIADLRPDFKKAFDHIDEKYGIEVEN